MIYSYHSSRRRSQLVVRQPTGNPLTNSYTWDGGGRLSTLASPAGTHTYQYNGQGNLVRKLLIPNSTFVTNTFDGAARLLDSRYMVDSTWAVLNQHGYVYNNAHERTTLSRTNSSNTGWNGYSTATYDGAGEVREVRAYNASGVSVPGENFFYGYDAGWNLLKRTNNLTISTYTPNELNQAAGSYDSNGNRTSGADSYTYDVENQLIGIEEASSWKLEFVYDGRQRLRVIKDYEYSGGVYTLKGEVRLMYDGMNVIQERNGSGHPTVSYTRGLDLSGSLEGAGGIGGLLTRSSHATSSPYQQNSHAFYHADGNGNVTYLRRSDGASYAAYKYDPFGRTLSSAGGLASANRMRFSSKPWIQSSSGTDGMYYYGYRFYDPLTQRWMNRDPIGEWGGYNLYGFTKNGPLYKIDPWGLCQCTSGEAKTTVKSQAVSVGKSPRDDKWIEIADQVIDSVGRLPVKKPLEKTQKALTGFAELISSLGAPFNIYMTIDIECCISGSWKSVGSKTIAIENGKETTDYSLRSIKEGLVNPVEDVQNTMNQMQADANAICAELANAGGVK